jgi:hypothetical protein
MTRGEAFAAAVDGWVAKDLATLRVCGVPMPTFLFAINLLATCIHAAMATAVLVAGSRHTDGRLSLEVTMVVPVWQNLSANPYTYEVRASNTFRGLQLHHLCAAFALLSAVFHASIALAASPCGIRSTWLRTAYFGGLRNCFAPWRWAEYCISAPLMAVALLALTGVRDQSALVLTFVGQSVTMLCGLLTELLNRPVSGTDGIERVWPPIPLAGRFAPFLVGCWAYVPTWVVYFVTFATSADAAWECCRRSPPVWVIWLLATQVGLFSIFTIPLIVFQLLPPKHYVWAEVVYALLSLTSKTALNGTLLAQVIVLGRLQVLE